VSEELWFLTIALVTFLVDRTIAALSVERIQVVGFQSRPHLIDRRSGEARKEQALPGAEDAAISSGSDIDTFKVYCFILQNDEDVPVEWRRRPMRATIRIRGRGKFHRKYPIDFTSGPDDQARFIWKQALKEVEILIPWMRPHKTWTIRCNVDHDVQEMECELDIPTTSWMRQLVERVNSAVFHSKNLEYHSQRVVVRRSEDPNLSRRFAFAWRTRWLTILPTWFVSAAAYYFINQSLMRVYPMSDGDGLAQFIQSPWSNLPAGMFLLLAFLGVYELAKTDPLPIAQGYQVSRQPKFEEPVDHKDDQPQPTESH
jgi:hypothetical protein